MKASVWLPDKFTGMNKVEREWALQLEGRCRRAGEVKPGFERNPPVLWRYEKVRFILAKGTSYLPDFWVLFADGHIEAHEIKQVHKSHQSGRSGWRSASAVKFKTAAELFPEIVWVACERQLDGTWKQTKAEDLFKRKS